MASLKKLEKYVSPVLTYYPAIHLELHNPNHHL